eukprot:COSAG01_NODE_3465_length_6056_cov_32.665268_2_plen_271_part_00
MWLRALMRGLRRAAPRSHFNVSAHTRNATCEESALYDPPATSATKPCSSGSAECALQFFTGEIFLALSPSLMFSASLGILSTDSTHIDLTLVDGWDACMPTAPASGVHAVDGLVAWMMQQAGRRGGYVARERWPPTTATITTNTTAVTPLGLEEEEEEEGGEDYPPRWTVLDVAACGVGASSTRDGSLCTIARYSPSNQLLLFWGMYFFTLFWAVNAIHFYYIQWITRQDDDLHWAKLFVPFEDLVECDNVERTRAATFASFCRRQAMGG